MSTVKEPSVGEDVKKESEKNNVLEERYKMDFSVSEISLEKMLKNGVHFGHNKSCRDPRMNKFIFGTKRSINIIDLQKTEEKLKEAMEFAKKLKEEKKQILFVGTKKQAKAIVKISAIACEMPHVTERWLGGTFTNFGVIRKRAQYLKDSQEQMAVGGFDKYTKLEKLKKTEELEKLEKKMGGLKEMKTLPAAIFISDIKTDEIALKEALNAKIPVIAIVDTNVNPNDINYPIPANDDAVSSVKTIMEYLVSPIVK
ncbi:MAG: 30S ribosomal protein S2 [uncultured bacterium]|nr:MAG: 30S ribosomal protein S2 [uncultured bacterium]KKP68464.1 MAG: 30S ribosomal protein S2 [Candidatus Moranbacteria bacterium GW2011_GWE1_35_17]KKP81575.1 MAG: 30S ribosomal protein S2 [Candidatus Moranbacteria bacterium GW2011_GWF1_35_5]KKP83859.1 MAG: 30S ribosomal protein S2 [Candidatus Moranbacteria bacterium GW2011_GWF2_35_54]HBR79474.1 30S ribosomal protein S2 [Candidatus Moranbacteria bacterium]